MKKILIIIIIMQFLTLLIGWGYLSKYIPLEYALRQVKHNEYREGYNCVGFSKDLINELQKVGIQSELVVGKDRESTTSHAWVGIWIEPQTGNFTNNYRLNKNICQ